VARVVLLLLHNAMGAVAQVAVEKLSILVKLPLLGNFFLRCPASHSSSQCGESGLHGAKYLPMQFAHIPYLYSYRQWRAIYQSI